jgi:SAM-dependent methyltransferase
LAAFFQLFAAAMSGVRVEEFAHNLQLKEQGLWISKEQFETSYPEGGHSWCLSVEESSFWFKHRNRCIIEMMKAIPPEGFLLDVGGGNGFVSLAIEKAGWKVALVEPGKGALNARSRGLSTVINSTFENAGLKPHSIPAIGLFDVLEHIRDDVGFLAAINAALIVAGKLYITVPAYNFLWSRDDEVAGHFRRYSASLISTRLRQAGFRIDFLTFIFVTLPAPIFLFRVLPEKIGIGRSADLSEQDYEHRKPKGLLGRLFDELLYLEILAIRKGYSAPFGGSLLLAASSL